MKMFIVNIMWLCQARNLSRPSQNLKRILRAIQYLQLTRTKTPLKSLLIGLKFTPGPMASLSPATSQLHGVRTTVTIAHGFEELLVRMSVTPVFIVKQK